ncbi:MAG: efflux RND transporter permease subunit [Candidatus Aminicenantes bacterium]|nr:efflux RND transporter permease subunit [Candidatus Aminicenantes bacterium]
MKILIERPVAVSMVFLALLALGVYSYLHTPLELEPKEDYPQATISASWPGSPPEVMQTRVTAPLEEAVSAVKAVRKVSSSSEIGLSSIVVDFDPKADVEFVQLALREELANLRTVLPAGVRPTITPFVPEDFRVNPFLQYTISGSGSLQALRGLIKDKIEFGLGSVKGVSRVVLTGGSDPEFRIVLDKAKLKAYGLQPYAIIQAVSRRLGTYPSGRVLDGTREILFKYGDKIRDKNELGETIVGSSGGGNVLRVCDVASVETTYADVSSIHRINGRPTVSFIVSKEKGMNTVQTARAVKAKLALLRKEVPADLVFQIVDDESREIAKNFGDLYLLAGIITVVVFLMIFVVLRRFAPSLLILTSIAFSVVITFNLIYFFKISLNMMTLGALALGFGMFVDNSIVVFENILRLRESGVPPRDAAIRGPKEVFIAVLASTLTTVAVFFSFPFFQGRLKMYYLPLAIVIGSALMASLFISFTLIPALSPRLVDKRCRDTGCGPSLVFGRFLRFCLRHPLEVMLVVAAVIFGSYRWFKAEVSTGEWFSFTSREYLIVSIGLSAGTDIERTDATIKTFEDLVLAHPYPKEMNVYVYSVNAYLRIGFPPEIERSSVPYVLKEELIRTAAQFAGLNIYVTGFDPQYYSSSLSSGSYLDSRIKFFGYNLKKLKEITADVEQTLRRNPRIKDVRITSDKYGRWRGDSLENILKIDQVRLQAYDVDPEYLYGYLQTLIRGRFGAPMIIRTGGKEMSIAVKFPDADTLDLRGVKESLIQTRRGEYFRLGEVAELIERPIAGSIDRENQQFQQTVSWEFRGPSKAADRYRKSIFAGLHVPAGFSASLEDDWRMTGKERTQVRRAVAMSLILIFMIIAALFESLVQPFYIMSAVPLGLIGVFVAFVVAGTSFDSSAYIGIILLSGIVVNNAILLVDHINRKRKQGLALLEGVVEGARERVRPILMTAGTTVFGILPMLFIPAGSGRMKIWSSLALCTVGGVTSSTLLLLIVVPVVYVYGERLRNWAAAIWHELRRRSS